LQIIVPSVKRSAGVTIQVFDEEKQQMLVDPSIGSLIQA